jgi:hypothetical protein
MKHLTKFEKHTKTYPKNFKINQYVVCDVGYYSVDKIVHINYSGQYISVLDSDEILHTLDYRKIKRLATDDEIDEYESKIAATKYNL